MIVPGPPGGRRLRPRLFDVDQAHVNSLPSARLVAMYGQDDFRAGLETFASGRADLDGLVGRDVARLPGRKDAVDVDLDVLVVIERGAGRGRGRSTGAA